jgi:hypothetical protein
MVTKQGDRSSYLLPDTPLSVKIVDATRLQNLTSLESTTVFTMECTHGPYRWEIRRNTREFRTLHEDIHALAVAKRIKVSCGRC